jgi:hypothetical protein
MSVPEVVARKCGAKCGRGSTSNCTAADVIIISYSDASGGGLTVTYSVTTNDETVANATTVTLTSYMASTQFRTDMRAKGSRFASLSGTERISGHTMKKNRRKRKGRKKGPPGSKGSKSGGYIAMVAAAVGGTCIVGAMSYGAYKYLWAEPASLTDVPLDKPEGPAGMVPGGSGAPGAV